MFRRITAIAVATVVMLSLIPVIAANALSAAAVLTSGTEVFPGTNSFTVRVTNNESMVLGGRADAIRLLLPSDFSSPVCVASGAFTCTAAERPGPDLIDLTGALLAAGSSVDIRFSANVNNPLSGDRTNAIAVSISDESSTDLVKIADLTNRVRALDILATSLRPTGPAGVVDGTGTVGQTITYTFDVRNHAQSAQEVTATLTSSSGIRNQTGSIPGLQVSSFTFSVNLRDIGSSASVTDAFTASAVSATSTAPQRAAVFTIEHAPAVLPQANTFSNPFIRTNAPITYDLAIDASKQFPPGVNVLTGNLSFAGLSTSLESPTALNRGNGNVRLSYAPLVVPSSVAEGPHDVTFTFAGTDDNGAPWTFTQTLAGLITIDNLGPVVTVATSIAGGKPQAKNGDTINVTGTVNDTATAAPLDYVRLVSAEGTIIPVTVTRNGTNFSGSVQISGLPDYTSLRGEAAASDRAGNTGLGVTTSMLDIDNVLPVVTDPARVVKGSDYGLDRPVVEVTFDERYSVKGACIPTHWTLTGATVTEVRYSNGQPCQRGQVSPTGDNIRILVPLQTIDPDVNYSGSYRQTPSAASGLNDPALDGALNSALDRAFDTISGIAPNVPDLGLVTRNQGAESNPLRADGAHHTRFAGDDARVQVRNTRAGYVVQVLDHNNNVISSQPTNGPNATITVPIGNTDGSYTRRLRLVNTSGLTGEKVELRIVLDRVAPTIGVSTRNQAGNQVVAATSEVLIGALNPNDWFVAETDDTPGNNFHFYGVDAITANGPSVHLTTQLGNNGPFAGVVYEYFGGAAGRPQDWAGNSLGDDYTP